MNVKILVLGFFFFSIDEQELSKKV